MRFYSLTILFLVFSFLSQSQNRIDSVEYKYGGGVTGQLTSFRFSFRKITTAVGTIDPPYSYYKKLKKSTWKNITNQANILLNLKLTYQKPSNYYESIVVYSLGERHVYTWSRDDKQLPTEIHSILAQLKKNIIP